MQRSTGSVASHAARPIDSVQTELMIQQQQQMMLSSHQFGAGSTAAPMLVNNVCEYCFSSGGRHTKKCPNRYADESPEQKARRLKREERQRDQELGQEYVDAEKQAEKTFTEYWPSRLKDISGLRVHPDPVTETSALNSVNPPPLTYKMKIPHSVILGGCLTNLQLEAILYACDQHQRMLPHDVIKGETAVRAGFFMGDGPGVGKGRQIAGIVTENFLRGRKKAVWISVGPDLLEDARRDLRDIGAGAIPVHDLKDWKATRSLSSVTNSDLSQGVLFCTYTLLARDIKTQGGGDKQGAEDVQVEDKSRLKQIVDWCGRDFDGVIAFDEAHKAKNMTMKVKSGANTFRSKGSSAKEKIRQEGEGEGTGGGSSSIDGTASAQAVLLLQKLLPLARVVYVSATGASEPEHLLYASRLGLWGTGTSFSDANDFAKEIREGGPSAMELLAMQMKQSGKYLARSLSFKGASFEVVDVPLTKEFEDKYDAAVDLWNDVRAAIIRGTKAKESEMAGKVDEAGNPIKLGRQTWRGLMMGAHQRFFGQMLMAAKVEETVRISQEAVEEGKCVVIGIQNTGEAGLSDEAGADGCSAADHVLRSLILKCAEFLDEDTKKDFFDRLSALKLPVNPLDDLMDRLGGPRRVAEMTGRKTRQVCEHGEWVMEKRIKGRESEDTLNIQERKNFMSGRKLVAIISDAASTGISLQADRRVKNDRRRVHVTLQLPWSADKAVQQMGRSHRSNQSSAPEFKLMMTPIGGEWRFASAVAERLQQLGAITQGDRRASGGAGLTAFAVDGVHGQEAINEFSESLRLRRPWRDFDVSFLDPSAEAADESDKEKEKKFKIFAEEAKRAFLDAGLELGKDIKINTFLNRLLGLKLKLQTQVFSYWHVIMEELIRDAKKTGKFQEGILDIGSELAMVKEHVLFEDPQSGINTCLNKLVGDRGVSWDKAKSLLDGQENSFAGFYRRVKNDRGFRDANLKKDVYNIFLALEKPQMVKNKTMQVFITVEPHSGYRPDEILRKDLRNSFEKLSDEEAKHIWDEVFALSKDKCSCKRCDEPQKCELKKRSRAYHILTGSVLPFWSTIKAYMLSQEGKDVDDEDKFSIKVVRVETKDARRLVGILIPNENAEAIKDEIDKAARKLISTSASVSSETQNQTSLVPLPSEATSKDPDAGRTGADDAEQMDPLAPASDQIQEDANADGGADTEKKQMARPAEVHGDDELSESCESESDCGLAIKESEEEEEIDVAEEESQLEILALEQTEDPTEEGEQGGGSKAEPEVATKRAEVVSVGEMEGDVISANVSGAHRQGVAAEKEGVAEAENVEPALGPEISRLADKDAGEETESDTEPIPITVPSGSKDDLDKHGGANVSESGQNLAGGVSERAIVAKEELPASAIAGNGKSRDSILSKADTPAKDFGVLHSGLQSEGDDEDQKESCKSSSRSFKDSLDARMPTELDLVGTGDKCVNDDEMKDHDVNTKQELTILAQRRNAGAAGSDQRVLELEASGLWEHDDDAEDFFAEGLKMIEAARKKDECSRRRYNPSKEKSLHKKNAKEEKSKSGRVRKQTRHFASSRMEGQKYVDGNEDAAFDGETATESEGDDESAAGGGRSSARERRPHKARASHAPKKRQEASAVMIDKALKGDVNARKVRVDASGKSAIKEMAGAFLGGLLGRPELSGTMREKAVKAAIRCWVGHLDGVALSMCSSSDTPSKHLIVPKQPLKRQLKMLHPSCAGGTLTSLSNAGIRRVEAILGFFCQALVNQVTGLALARGATIISREWLMDADKGIENLKDATLRMVLGLEPLPEPAPLTESQEGQPDPCPVLCANIASKPQRQDDACLTDAERLRIEKRKDMLECWSDCEGSSKTTQKKSKPTSLTVSTDTVSDPSGVQVTPPTIAMEEDSGMGVEAMPMAHRPQSVENLASDDDDDGGKTESETDIDADEEGDADGSGDGMVTEDEDGLEAELETSTFMDPADDFRNRSHYCSSKCIFGNSYRPDQFMLCCEACDVWFHGKCLGLKEGTIADEQVWVCSQDCFDDLPLLQRKKDVVIRAPKRKDFGVPRGPYKKRGNVEGDQAEKSSKSRAKKTEKPVEENETNSQQVPWSEEYLPHFQSVCDQAPDVIDFSLVGRTIMYQLDYPVQGWFPAKIKHKFDKKKNKSKFLLSYLRTASKGLMQGERETVLDLANYGNQGMGKFWVLLQYKHDANRLGQRMPPADKDHLYCKKSCKMGRENANDFFMIYCEGCGVWFHGPCVGVGQKDVDEDSIWVCCQKCKYDLPRNLRVDALVGSSFKTPHTMGTACAASAILKHPSASAPAAGDSEDDDDIPILQRSAFKTAQSSAANLDAPADRGVGKGKAESDASNGHSETANKKAEEVEKDRGKVVAEQSPNLMNILEPLASFLGANRMHKREALTAVLAHVRTHNLFDPTNDDYVVADDVIRKLAGDDRVKTGSKLKLRKLAKRVAKYIVEPAPQDNSPLPLVSAAPAQLGSGEISEGQVAVDLKEGAGESWLGLSEAEISAKLVGKEKIRKLFSQYGWYNGDILRFDGESCTFTVRYDDNEQEEMNLMQIIPLLPKDKPCHALGKEWLKVKEIGTCTHNKEQVVPVAGDSAVTHNLLTEQSAPPKVVPTPLVVHSEALDVSPHLTDSPQQDMQNNLKKRLGFSTNNSPASLDAPSANTNALSAPQAVEQGDEWVCCDGCSKWRKVEQQWPDFDRTKRFVCNMTGSLTCDTPEEAWDEEELEGETVCPHQGKAKRRRLLVESDNEEPAPLPTADQVALPVDAVLNAPLTVARLVEVSSAVTKAAAVESSSEGDAAVATPGAESAGRTDSQAVVMKESEAAQAETTYTAMPKASKEVHTLPPPTNDVLGSTAADQDDTGQATAYHKRKVFADSPPVSDGHLLPCKKSRMEEAVEVGEPTVSQSTPDVLVVASAAAAATTARTVAEEEDDDLDDLDLDALESQTCALSAAPHETPAVAMPQSVIGSTAEDDDDECLDYDELERRALACD